MSPSRDLSCRCSCVGADLACAELQRLLHRGACAGKTQTAGGCNSWSSSGSSPLPPSLESPDGLSVWWPQGSWTPYPGPKAPRAGITAPSQKLHPSSASPGVAWCPCALLCAEGVPEASPGLEWGYHLHLLMGRSKALEEREGWEMLWLLLINFICHNHLTPLSLIFVPPLPQIPVQNLPVKSCLTLLDSGLFFFLYLLSCRSLLIFVWPLLIFPCGSVIYKYSYSTYNWALCSDVSQRPKRVY